MRTAAFEIFGLNAKVLSPPTPMERVHHHQEIELNFSFRGHTIYLSQGRLIELPMSQLVVFWGATPHTLVSADANAEMAWVTIPMAWFWGWDLPGAFKERLMNGEWLVGKPTTDAARYPVRAWVDELQHPTPLRSQAILLELHACLLWMAEHVERVTPGRESGPMTDASQLQRVERMSRFIAERFAEEISIADVAAAAGIHPNYAMPLFRRICGVTILGYLTRYRVTHAQRLLITSDMKVIDIAGASGFRSLSTFYDAFGKLAGDSPQSYRTRMRQE